MQRLDGDNRRMRGRVIMLMVVVMVLMMVIVTAAVVTMMAVTINSDLPQQYVNGLFVQC